MIMHSRSVSQERCVHIIPSSSSKERRTFAIPGGASPSRHLFRHTHDILRRRSDDVAQASGPQFQSLAHLIFI